MNRYNEKTCHSCRYRHSCCPYHPSMGGECKHWRMGKCYTCKFINAPDDEWLKHGCEAECFGGCRKYKRNWKRTFELLKMKF